MALGEFDIPAVGTVPASAGNDVIEVTGANVAQPVVAPVIDANAIVASVTQSVTDHPDVHPSAVASVVAHILAGLYAAEPAIFAVTRASTKTQIGVGLDLDLFTMLLGAFVKR